MGKLRREKIKTETDWLKARSKRGIGGSEAAAIVGASPWMTVNDLWSIKTGSKIQKDISDDPFVKQGHRMEGALRELYKAYHPDFKVRYHKYDLLYQAEHPWLFATLDGEIVDSNSRKGIFEAKTSTPVGKAGWSKWDCQIPEQYMVQILHQMLATGWEFVDLMACLINQEGDFNVRTYHFERSEHEEDLKWLLSKEVEFWDTVQSNTLPPMTLVL